MRSFLRVLLNVQRRKHPAVVRYAQWRAALRDRLVHEPRILAPIRQTGLAQFLRRRRPRSTDSPSDTSGDDVVDPDMTVDIIERLMDFDNCGNTAADRVNLRECAAIEIHK